MPRPLPRYHRQEQARKDAAKVNKILDVVGQTETTGTAGSTAGGDWARLRGLPAVARGVSGATGGSDPVAALLRKNR